MHVSKPQTSPNLQPELHMPALFGSGEEEHIPQHGVGWTSVPAGDGAGPVGGAVEAAATKHVKVENVLEPVCEVAAQSRELGVCVGAVWHRSSVAVQPLTDADSHKCCGVMTGRIWVIAA